MSGGTTSEPAAAGQGELLGRTARGFGALELAIGDRLAWLARGDGTLRLSYSSIGDYAREVLGMNAHHARDLVHLAQALWTTPLLRAAVWDGRVDPEKAAVVVKAAARGDEARWIELARRSTVERLRAALGERPPDLWQTILLTLTPDHARVAGATMEVAGLVCERGPATSLDERLWAICAESLSTFGDGGGRVPPLSFEPPPRQDALAVNAALDEGAAGVLEMLGVPEEEEARAAPGQSLPGPEGETLAALEEELRRFADLTRLLPVPGPRAPSPHDLDAELRQLARLRAGWAELFGRLCRLAQMSGVWRSEGFLSWAHYCAVRFGRSERAIRTRVALERRLEALPGLRDAFRTGRLSFEKARLVSFAANPSTVAAWIERAAPIPAAELRRILDREEERKISGGGTVELRASSETAELFQDVCDGVRERLGRWLSPGECLAVMCEHFLEVHLEEASRNLHRMGRVRRRDGGFCRTPGCTRPGGHVHHIRFRSALGGNEDENLVSLCPAHHLHGVHRSFIRVEGTAPDGLTWWLGEKEVARSRAMRAG